MTKTEHTLELVKVTGSTGWHKGKEIALPAYDVVLNGQVVGRVSKTMITRERRTPGNRYVNARWQSPGWRYNRLGSRFSRGWECGSRKDGIERLLMDADLSRAGAKELAETVAKVR